jgi:hypothetical protein
MELNSEPERVQRDLTNLVKLVAQMREHQRNYFRYRDPISLREAKQAEKLVDTELERLTGVRKTSVKPQHPKLF